jgi:hypothetical protein
VFEKIVDHGDSKARIQDLNRLGTIRNYFAHCGQEIVPIETGEGYTPDPRKPDKPVDFAALYAEFREIAPRVELFLKDVFVSMGGEVSDTLPKAGLTSASRGRPRAKMGHQAQRAGSSCAGR